MKRGDCFFGAIPPGKFPHYWVLLSEPGEDGAVALVNFTSPSGSLKAQVMRQQDFPTLEYDSEVAWGFAVVKPLAAVEKAIAMNLFHAKKCMTQEGVNALIKGGLERGIIPREVSKRLLSN